MAESPSSGSFTCKTCGSKFTLKKDVLARYPGWKPSVCMPCKNKSRKSSGSAGKPSGKKRPPRRAGAAKEENLPLAVVLEKYTGGPVDGIFTDGACAGNPGPGGWGTVWVRDNQVVEQAHGHEERTTNNRMEMRALIAAYEMLPSDAEVTIWSDSNLCVSTLNEWAEGWKKRGWTRKTGPVENLDLVRRAYELSRTRPFATLKWIKAHSGNRWNEYADSLATAFQRDEL